MEFIAAGLTTASDRRRPKVAALGQAADCRSPFAVRARRILLLLEAESTIRHSRPLVLAMEKKKTSGYKSVLNCSITPLAIEKSKMLVVRDGAKSQGDDRFVVHGLKKRERLSRSWRRGPIRTWYACSFALKQASGQPWSEQICSNIKRPAFAHHTVWMNFIEF